MSRIFLVLAIVSAALLVTAASAGLLVGKYNELYASLLQNEQQARAMQASGREADVDALRDEIDRLVPQLDRMRRRATLHMLLGILASLVAVLVNSISVTYFIGTSRWCKEVVDTYELDESLAAQSARLKRKSFPWALAGILLVLMIVAFGAASDPGTLRETTGRWVLPHFAAALGGGAMIMLSFWMQADYIRRNSQIVEQILAEVRAIRLERGLDVEG